MKKLLPIAVLAALLIATLFTSVTQIDPGERAVVRRFGRVLDDKPAAGLHLFLPWGMDRIERVKVNQVREVTVGRRLAEEDETATPQGQLLTGDHNLVDVQVKVYYSVIDDPVQIEKFALQAGRIDELLTRATENALAEWTASRAIGQVLLEGKRVLPGWLRDEVSRRVSVYDLGIRIDPLPSVMDLAPPRQVKQAFDAVAQAEAERETRLERAKQSARKFAGDASIAVMSSQARAARHQTSVRAQAKAEAAGFLGEVARKRALPADQVSAYLALRWWTVMSRTYDKMQEGRRIRPLDDFLTGDTLQLNVPLVPGQK